MRLTDRVVGLDDDFCGLALGFRSLAQSHERFAEQLAGQRDVADLCARSTSRAVAALLEERRAAPACRPKQAGAGIRIMLSSSRLLY